MVWDAYFNDKKDDSDTSQETLQVEEKQEEQAIIDEAEGEKIEKEKVQQFEGEDPNNNEELSGVITYAEPIDGKLMIRVSIDQYLGNGECYLSLHRNGTLIHNEVVGISSGAATASCDGFDVPLDGLGSGRIDIVVELSSNGKNGTIRGEANV